MAEFDYGALSAYLQPNEDDRKRALQSSLMAAGFGILANNNQRGMLGPALGAGGMYGMQNYHQTLAQLPRERGAAITQAMQVRKLGNELKREDMLTNFYGGGGTQPARTPAPAGGSIMPASMEPGGAATPGPAPRGPEEELAFLTNYAASGGNATPLLEAFKLRNPEIKWEGGIPLHPRTGQPMTGAPLLPKTNQAGFSTTPKWNAQTGQFEVGVTPGAEAAFSTQQDIQNRSQARFGQPIDVEMPDGTKRRMTPEQFSDYNRNAGMRREPPAQTVPQPPAPQDPPGGKIPIVARDLEDMRKLQKQYARQGIPVRVRYVDKDGRTISSDDPVDPMRPNAPPIPTSSLLDVPGVPSGLSEEQKRKNKSIEAGSTELAGIHAKRVGALEEKIPGLNSTLRRLDRLEQLTVDDTTYAAAGAELKSQLGSVAQALGLSVNKDKTANTEEYLAHVAELLKERLSSKDYGSGTGVSNLDLATAGRPLPEVIKTSQGRQQIITALRADTKRALGDANAAREHFAKNKTLDGFTYPSETEAMAPPAAPPASDRTAAPVRKPMRGQVINGFRYTGGDPNSATSWRKVD